MIVQKQDYDLETTFSEDYQINALKEMLEEAFGDDSFLEVVHLDAYEECYVFRVGKVNTYPSYRLSISTITGKIYVSNRSLYPPITFDSITQFVSYMKKEGT